MLSLSKSRWPPRIGSVVETILGHAICLDFLEKVQ